MKKRVLSMLLVMLLVFSLLPAAALAASPVNPAQADLGEDLHMTKKLELTEDGSYKLTLESWATGKTTQIGGDPIPSDIVLVIDQSGSMGYDMLNRAVTAEELYRIADSDGRTPYVSSAWLDHNIYITKNSNGTYTIYFDRLIFGRVYIAQNVTGDTLINPQNREFKISRLEATKIALRDFVDSIAAKNGDHRIAIVGFASENSNTEIFNGSNSNSYNTVMSSSTNYAEYSLKNASTQKSVLNSSINALSADGGTLADRGMELAEKILSQRTDAEGRGAAVILFTDGNPGLYGDDNGVANNAIAISNRIENNLSGKVFTLGVFDSADGDSALINENEIYKVKDYMEGVSSMYPSLTNMSQLYATPAPEADTSAPYYQKITGNSGDDVSLSEMFDNISEVIDITGTTVTLDGDSVLRDVIKSADFNVAPGAAVSAKAVKMADGTDDAAATGELQYSATVPANGVIDVKGFDYSNLYHTDGHPGDKLVVTITGLIPKHEGNLESNVNAGVFETADASEAVLAIGSPTLEIENKAVIIDYNYPVQLTTTLGNDNISINGGAFTTEGKSGTYTKSGTSLTYQLSTSVLNPTEGKRDDSTALTDKYDVAIKAYAGADTAVFFETGNTWKAVTTVPANTVYYDDDILNTPVASGTIKGTGYNAGMTESEADDFAGKMVYYTFKGTGIDVYSTTTDTSKLITAEIIDQDGNVVSSRSMRNFSETERLNVPSVFFRDLPYGEYTLTLYASNNANYKIDGIRVYNPAGADETANGLYAEKREQNATFNNLREMLLANGTDLIGADRSRLNGVGFFLDNGTKNATLANYTVDGPKNEIYLAKNTGVAFKIDNWQNLQTTYGTDIKLMVGLSVPDANNTSSLVKLSDMVNGEVTVKEQTVSSPVDMYYEVVPNAQGIVMIFNTGDKMVSLTNLKISGGTAPITASFEPTDATVLSVSEEAAEAVMNLVVDQDTLDYAANFASLRTTAEATAEHESQLVSMIRELISNFVMQLFNNIARLFGK